MSVDTKGVIATPVKDVLAVSAIIEQALNRLIRRARLVAYPDRHVIDEAVLNEFKNVSTSLSYGASFVRMDFIYKGEHRNLNVHFDCDSDSKAIAKESLILSLGLWGSSELIMRTVLHALSVFGEAYIDVNDSDSVDIAKVEVPRLTLFQALAHQYLSAYQLERLVEKFQQGKLGMEGSLEDFLGISEERFNELMAIADSQLRWGAMESEAKACFEVIEVMPA